MKDLDKEFTLIPKKVDLIFTGKGQVLCSRQAIINFIRKREKELLDEIGNALDVDGVSDTRAVIKALKLIRKKEKELSNE